MILRGGLAPRLPWGLTIAARGDLHPFPLAAAETTGVPAGAAWLLLLAEDASVVKRNVFLVFDGDEAAPRWVVKVARTPGFDAPFARERRGLELAAGAGRVVARHAPRRLGDFVAAGYPGSVETAANGVRLSDLLASRASRQAKLDAIGRVCAWLVEVAAHTGCAGGMATADREWLSEVVLKWTAFGAAPDLLERVADVPKAFQHGDLWSANVLVDRGSFTVIDWEAAGPRRLPLGDLVCLLSDALAIADACAGDDHRVQHMTRLFRGELPSSRFALDWLRRACEASGIAPEAIGPAVTLFWLERGYRPWRGPFDGPPEQRPLKARLAHAWLSDPRLGNDWRLDR